MKKWIIVLCSIFFLLVAGAYFFIPDKIVVTKSVTAKANQAGVFKFLNEDSNWKKWWPADLSSADSGSAAELASGDYRFKKNNTLYNSFQIDIQKGEDTDSSFLYLLSMGADSIKIDWITTLQKTGNPFSKIRYYLKARELGKKLEAILAAMQKYVSKTKNIYGIEIREEKIQLEFLASTKKRFDRYPTTEDIYTTMGQIRNYMAQVQVTETDYPVLNIRPIDSIHFELLVAIPINRQLPGSGNFASMRLLKNGNMLVTEITGGINTVESALKRIDAYAYDHQYRSIALPFQSFLTDRMKVADTSKWVTRVGYPIL